MEEMNTPVTMIGLAIGDALGVPFEFSDFVGEWDGVADSTNLQYFALDMVMMGSKRPFVTQF